MTKKNIVGQNLTTNALHIVFASKPRTKNQEPRTKNQETRSCGKPQWTNAFLTIRVLMENTFLRSYQQFQEINILLERLR